MAQKHYRKLLKNQTLIYTESDSKVGFWLRWLCSKFIAFTCALCLHNGRSLQAKNLRSRLAKFPNFESLSVYRNNLKNWGFGKTAPQNFASKQATIAQGQGASENQDS